MLGAASKATPELVIRTRSEGTYTVSEDARTGTVSVLALQTDAPYAPRLVQPLQRTAKGAILDPGVFSPALTAMQTPKAQSALLNVTWHVPGLDPISQQVSTSIVRTERDWARYEGEGSSNNGVLKLSGWVSTRDPLTHVQLATGSVKMDEQEGMMVVLHCAAAQGGPIALDAVCARVSLPEVAAKPTTQTLAQDYSRGCTERLAQFAARLEASPWARPTRYFEPDIDVPRVDQAQSVFIAPHAALKERGLEIEGRRENDPQRVFEILRSNQEILHPGEPPQMRFILEAPASSAVAERLPLLDPVIGDGWQPSLLAELPWEPVVYPPAVDTDPFLREAKERLQASTRADSFVKRVAEYVMADSSICPGVEDAMFSSLKAATSSLDPTGHADAWTEVAKTIGACGCQGVDVDLMEVILLAEAEIGRSHHGLLPFTSKDAARFVHAKGRAATFQDFAAWLHSHAARAGRMKGAAYLWTTH